MNKRNLALDTIKIFLNYCLAFLSQLGVSESAKEDEGLRAIKQHIEHAVLGCENEKSNF